MTTASLAERIDALLPQTQCTRCGYPACRPYAEAIAAGDADINRCPPGGAATIDALAALTARAPSPLDPACGSEGPLALAVIDEATCIGCTLCIAACPVDAIIGGPKRMHTVLASLCTGCELCIPPCPVDCIALRPAARAWTATDAGEARQRYVARERRLARDERPADRAATPRDADAHAARKAAVDAALARARARRAGVKP
ncbi:MAG: RnfABCDGE type electron transport complex subunit B [Casimicrobiaceae bacterium]